jgi:hypothetical protein
MRSSKICGPTRSRVSRSKCHVRRRVDDRTDPDGCGRSCSPACGPCRRGSTAGTCASAARRPRTAPATRPLPAPPPGLRPPLPRARSTATPYTCPAPSRARASTTPRASAVPVRPGLRLPGRVAVSGRPQVRRRGRPALPAPPRSRSPPPPTTSSAAVRVRPAAPSRPLGRRVLVGPCPSTAKSGRAGPFEARGPWMNGLVGPNSAVVLRSVPSRRPGRTRTPLWGQRSWWAWGSGDVVLLTTGSRGGSRGVCPPARRRRWRSPALPARARAAGPGEPVACGERGQPDELTAVCWTISTRGARAGSGSVRDRR